MQENTRRYIYLAVFLAALVAALLYSLPAPASSVRHISLTGPGLIEPTRYILTPAASERLALALQGEAVDSIAGAPLAVYTVTVSPGYMLPRAYEVTITAERQVYLKRPLWDRIVRSSEPGFFFTHEGFLAIYPYAGGPSISLSLNGQSLNPSAQEKTWSYQKWDESWHALPPAIEAAAPAAVPAVLTSLDDPPVYFADPPPDRVELSVLGPAGVVFSGSLSADTLPLFAHNGSYVYDLSLYWDDREGPYAGQYHASFALDIALPPKFILPGPHIVQGELAAFYALHMPPGVQPVLETDLARTPVFFPYQDGYVVYIPTHYGTKAGQHRLSYGLPGHELEEGSVTVVTREFHIQYMTIDPNVQAATQNPAAYEQFNRYFPPSRQVSSPERYYSEPFVMPVAVSRLTTEFGQTRYVNNAPTSSRHSGLDMAAPTGTPIYATNRGRVTLSMDLILTGKTLVIDHGQGLFSVHFHMHELFVQKDEIVERGQQVGTVGSTGFSTGPHLHFTMSFYSHNLEPGYFLVGEPITFANSVRYLGR